MPAPNPTPRGEPTRARIVESALRLFHEKGYETTSIAEVLAAAKTSSSSMYHFFPSKEDLLQAVIEEYEERVRTTIMEPAFRGVEDPRERIFSIFRLYRSMLEDWDFAGGCPVGNLALEICDACPEARRGLARVFRRWKGEVEGCLAEAFPHLQQKEHRSLASLVLTLLEGAILQARVDRRMSAFDGAVEHLRRYLEVVATATETTTETS